MSEGGNQSTHGKQQTKQNVQTSHKCTMLPECKVNPANGSWSLRLITFKRGPYVESKNRVRGENIQKYSSVR